MCGIACLIEPARQFHDGLLCDIEAGLFHRGPDSGGRIAEPGWALVFRRLAIMDPTPGSDQPMTNAEAGVSLVYNGEVYNFLDLRAQLEAAGVRFQTEGDSEVVLLGYCHWGEAVFDKLEGMFTVGLVDRRRGRFLAVRDPLGIKPLYIASDGRLTAVASEILPLTRLVGAAADPAALPELLTFGWAAGRLSNYRKVKRLPGGTLLSVDLSTGERTERRFCDPLETLSSADPTREDEAHDAVRRSVRDHLMSDVGYSLQLSGGVDSSLVVALATEAANTTLDTFSVALDDPRFDERGYRTPLIERYRLFHQECHVDAATFADMLPKAIRAMEGPVPHGGCVALYALCQTIAENHKVVLTGEGADEMFGGYLRYALWNKLAWQEQIDRLWPSLLPVPNIWPLKGVHRLRHRDYAAYAALYENLTAMTALFPDLLPMPSTAREAVSDRFAEFRDRLFAVDQTAYLESLLVRQDKMSMASSVEARVPFVHLPLLKVVNALPRDLRTPGGRTKPVLKRLADRYLPHDLVHRRKVGLLLPYNDWAADPAGLGRYLDDLTAPDGRLRALTDGKRLDTVVAAFRRGQRQGLPRIFALINVEQWLRSIDKPVAA